MSLVVYSLVFDGGAKSTARGSRFGGFRIPVKIVRLIKLIVPFSGPAR
jgi:hypothetical protein